MVPILYQKMAAIPITENGKTNAEELLKNVRAESINQKEYVAPRNDLEKKLVAIYEEVLGKEKIGVKDDFFALGGHSLKAVQAITKVQGEFDVKLDLQELYLNATIEGIAEELNKILLIKLQGSEEAIEKEEKFYI